MLVMVVDVAQAAFNDAVEEDRKNDWGRMDAKKSKIINASVNKAHHPEAVLGSGKDREMLKPTSCSISAA